MGNYTIFIRCSKILGEAGKQEIVQQVLRKFQISNRLPNGYFPKPDVGCPWKLLQYFIPLEIDEEKKIQWCLAEVQRKN